MKLKFWKRKKEKQERTGTRRAILALLILAPICGEMLSGSAPPLTWINPVLWIFLIMLYGSGALLIRELVHRWNKGWPSIILLGMAYGIYEEGLVVRSFFDPTWEGLDRLAWYGRALGVNWVWALNLTWFHTTISIVIPILIVDRLLYPKLQDRPWLTRRGMRIHTLLFLAWLPLGITFEMHAPLFGYIGCALLIGLLWYLARHWPHPDSSPEPTKSLPRLRRIWLFGFASMFGLFTTLWIIPSGGGMPNSLGIVASLCLPLIIIWRIRRLNAWSWGLRQQWAFAAGMLGLWIGLALLGVAGSDMPLAGIGFTCFLWRLQRRVWAQTRHTDDDASATLLSDVSAPVGFSGR